MQYRTNEYDVYHLIKFLWFKKYYVLTISFCALVVSTIWSFSMPNEYKSEITLAPTEGSHSSALSNMTAQFGGLASLAGINIPNNSGDKVALAIEYLQTRIFLTKFIKDNEIQVPLIAGKEWNSETHKLEIDPQIYDTENSKWVRLGRSGSISPPSDLELFNRFTKLIEIDRDKSNGIVTISIQFLSPTLSEAWLRKLVSELNMAMRSRDIQRLQQGITYLEGQITKTSNQEMRQVFYRLIQEQSKQLMLAEISDDYIFDVLDPAYIPIEPSEPNRFLLVLFFVFLSTGMTLFGLILHFLITPRKSQNK
ncbi:Wzz/FepE/Etk N-terminal domain-containing protein [Alteromonas facilis]|uniref:Wzz/FepE/Etk N-terminal domain-containing protein n=1 Tax=Alteromonas facilis TaxID=2048004 RepID=UPI000C287677|nr:Wzz/FepE/Etk N-terminal domain-containing protein [Alteromonas facilis]